MRRALLALSALLVGSEVARATWSIVVVDVETREVCVASATCIKNFPLDLRLPVIVVGEGAAAAQSLIDQDGTNRVRIWNGILAGETPDQILQALIAQDPLAHQRQYGIVTLDQGPSTWTGASCGVARHGVSGAAGNLRYAIQGNVLTGEAVVDAAEAALLSTQGDLAQRVMYAMEAAAALGGDGRCSCGFQPTACGVPPPNFQFSSYTSFITLARIGDTDGTCAAGGCANGRYWLDLDVRSNAQGPEPIVELRAQFESWRDSMALRPDGILSEVEPLADSLVADGHSQTAVLIHPRNLDGLPLSVNGVIGIDVVPLDPGPPSAVPGQAWWHGGGVEGVFGFALRATDVPGTARFALTLRQHNNVRIRLWPDLEIRVDPARELHVGRDELSARRGGRIPLTVGFGQGEAGRPYHIAASASGTSPGTPFGSAVLPVNTDSFFLLVQQGLGGARLPGFTGALDADGRAHAELVATPGLLNAWIGRRIALAAGLTGAPERTSAPTGFLVVP